MDDSSVPTEAEGSTRILTYEPHPVRAHVGGALRGWGRRTFSKDRVLGSLKTFLWVAPLTVLIWVYAEREQLASLKAFPFSVEVRSTDPNRVVRLIDPPDGKVRADLSGPHALLDKVRESLETGTGPGVKIDVDAAVAPGRHSIQAGKITNDPLFSSNGISVDNCMPSELTVYVDPLVERDLDVRAAPGTTNLVSPPLFQPRRVKVRLPQSLVDSGRLEAYAQLDGSPEMNTPGAHDLSAVPVTLWRTDARSAVRLEDSHVKITPGFVSAKVEVKNADVSYTIASMPVWVVYPPGMEEKYKAEYELVLPRVTVVGPDEQIKALQSPDPSPRPHAIFEISGDDQPGTEHKGHLRYVLPSGVHVSDDDANRMITYTLVPRKTAE